MTPRVTLFGYQLAALTMSQAGERLATWRGAPARPCRYGVTPNVHHTVMYQRHDGLRLAYRDASLVLADGMPIVLAGRLLRRGVPCRVTGSDLVPALFDRFGQRELSVYLLGAAPGVADRAAENIHARWPGARVVGTYSPPLGFEHDEAENVAILGRLSAAQPDVLVVGVGAPKQDLWVHAHHHQIDAKVALCGGAAIDFLAGHKPRAPRWMQRAGLEWFHRMAAEPRRLAGRYLHDAWYFPQLVCAEMLRGFV